MRSPKHSITTRQRATGACKTTLVHLQDTAESNDNNSPGRAAKLALMRMTEWRRTYVTLSGLSRAVFSPPTASRLPLRSVSRGSPPRTSGFRLCAGAVVQWSAQTISSCLETTPRADKLFVRGFGEINNTSRAIPRVRSATIALLYSLNALNSTHMIKSDISFCLSHVDVHDVVLVWICEYQHRSIWKMWISASARYEKLWISASAPIWKMWILASAHMKNVISASAPIWKNVNISIGPTMQNVNISMATRYEKCESSASVRYEKMMPIFTDKDEYINSHVASDIAQQSWLILEAQFCQF